MNALEVQGQCLHLAQKFGFVSRSVVWDFISPKGRTARYKHWRQLQKSPLFSPYILGSGSPEYLILSKKGKSLMGMDSVSEVPTIYLAHDEMVMRFYLHLLQRPSLDKVWSEAELKKDRILSIKCLGDGVISKLPDLLFDVAVEQDSLRFALEIERTRKSQGRYQIMRRAYQRAINVDVILFGVADKGIERAIEKEMNEAGLEFFGRDVGFFDLPEFAENQFDTTLRVSGQEVSLKKYFNELTLQRKDSADSRRHGVRTRFGEISEVS